MERLTDEDDGRRNVHIVLHRPSVSEKASYKQKLEVLQQQEELIEDEKEQEQKEEDARKARREEETRMAENLLPESEVAMHYLKTPSGDSPVRSSNLRSQRNLKWTLV